MSKGKYVKLRFFATAQDALDNNPLSGTPEVYWLHNGGIELFPEPARERLVQFVDRGGELSCLPFLTDVDTTKDIKFKGVYIYTAEAQFNGLLGAPVEFFRDAKEQLVKIGRG